MKYSDGLQLCSLYLFLISWYYYIFCISSKYLGIADALQVANTAPINNKNYNCSLPGLESFTPGQYEGVKVNYLSFATETSSPNFPIRAKELEACTGGTIAFAEAENVWEDPLADLGSGQVKGFELYDG